MTTESPKPSDEAKAGALLPPATGSAADVTKSTLPKKEWRDLAEDLLARFPGVDRADMLKSVVAGCFFEMKYGNKREERAACDLLNEIQRIAIRDSKPPNDEAHPLGTDNDTKL